MSQSSLSPMELRHLQVCRHFPKRHTSDIITTCVERGCHQFKQSMCGFHSQFLPYRPLCWAKEVFLAPERDKQAFLPPLLGWKTTNDNEGKNSIDGEFVELHLTLTGAGCFPWASSGSASSAFVEADIWSNSLAAAEVPTVSERIRGNCYIRFF